MGDEVGEYEPTFSHENNNENSKDDDNDETLVKKHI